MKTWTFQDPKQVAKHGAARATWRVGWHDPAGRRKSKGCGTGKAGKRLAAELAKKIQSMLILGTYEDHSKKTWEQYRREYTAKVLKGMNPSSAEQRRHALDKFEELVKPQKMQGITTLTLADFVTKRREERGQKPDSKISPATVNKDLRELRAVLRKAAKWGYIAKPIDFEFLRQMEKLPAFVSPDAFAALYAACKHAKLPDDLPFTPADWWRGLIVFAYMTGWRIGQVLAFRRRDLNFENGEALTRAEDNKGKRDKKIVLHPMVIEHLKRLSSFSPVFFTWNHDRRKLYKEFERIQAADKIAPPDGKNYYTFHDFRRAFATMNADRMTGDALQAIMQHKDYQTTKGYIALARQLRPAMENLFVPKITGSGTA